MAARVLVPVSPFVSAAPGQELTVQASPASAPPLEAQVALDHFVDYSVRGRAGETLDLTALDPSAMAISNSLLTDGPWQARLTVTIPAWGTALIRFLALKSEGTVGVRMAGTLNGVEISVVHRFVLTTYAVNIQSDTSYTTMPGGVGRFAVEVRPLQIFEWAVNGFHVAGTLRPDSPLKAARLRSSDPSVVRFQPNDPWAFEVLRAGEAIVDFDRRTGHATIDEFRVVIQAVAPRLDLGFTSIDLVSRADNRLVEGNAGLLPTGPLRLRSSNPAVLLIGDDHGGAVAERTLDLRNRYYFSLRATGLPGERASLLVAGAGVAEQTLPVRTGQPVLEPSTTEQFVPIPLGGAGQAAIWFGVRPVDGPGHRLHIRFQHSVCRRAHGDGSSPAIPRFAGFRRRLA